MFGRGLRLLPTRLSVNVSEGDDCQIKSLSLVSIDHNLPSGLNYIASHPPPAAAAAAAAGVENSISREPHHVFRAVMASLRLHCID